MKLTSETKALVKLHAIKSQFAETIRRDYEHRAKSCSACETPGACCLDAHFVNVHITRLEAVVISKKLETFSGTLRKKIENRIDTTIEKYRLTDPIDTFEQTYACPLFEKGIGCLVHEHGKPLSCIAHACYESKNDLPPGELLAEREIEVDKLNERVYGRPPRWLPLPVAIKNAEARTK